MYKIGEFSALTGLSVKTLRYYDEINLLKPSNVDSYTNYRYYTAKELQQFKRIEYLKKLGFTLEEIKNNLSNMTVECIDQKKQELITKRDIIIAQIYELDTLKENITNSKVKTLTRS
ncbi:MAG: MerR family transcriptional regulator [Bacilli bacterium]